MADSTTTKMACSQFGCSYSSQMMLHGNSNACCESVRQIHDGLSGHSVCPCQFDRVLQHRVASIPVNVLPRPSFGDAAFTIGSGTGLSAFYSPLARACDLKESAQPWRESWYLSQASRNPFELHGFDPHTHAACTRFAERFSPIDLAAAGARRKNATRETTSTLKAWLYEHRKNPYPTKGEKIMLAILTKMTLTQVSTWFANARRRLKKENKMTWSPRNRCGEKKDGGDASDVEDGDFDLNSDEEKQASENCEEKLLDIREVSTKEESKESLESKEVSSEAKPFRDYLAVVTSERSVVLRPKVINTTMALIPAPAPRSVPKTISPTVLQVSTANTVEDSPVKSLRKWVDGCFHNPTTAVTTYTMESSPLTCETPPTTPPHRTSTEIPVITSAPSSSSITKSERRDSGEKDKTRMLPTDDSKPDEDEPTKIKAAFRPAEQRSSETTNYREFDAALALTTLSSR